MKSDIQHQTQPVYPTLPFTKEVSRYISNLPEGFRELALKGIISTQVIERVGMDKGQIVRLASRATLDREHSAALRLNFTPLDHLIWMAFSAFHLCTATYEADREELADAFIECSEKLVDGSQAENECLLWGGCMVATVQAIENWELSQRQVALEILLSRFKMSIEEMKTVVQKFLWNDSMSAVFTKILKDQSIVPRKIEEGADWRTFQ